jgi:Tfp pilus assembly protein PilP
MKEKKTIILAVVLLLLVGVYVWYSKKVEKESQPTGKKLDITRVDPDFQLKAKVTKAIRNYIKDKGDAPQSLDPLMGRYLDQATLKLALSKNMRYVRTGPKSYRNSMSAASSVKLAAKKPGGDQKPAGATPSTATASATNIESLATIETGWQYDPTDKPDPFKPFILASAREETEQKPRPRLTPLQKMPLSEIQKGLKAIIWGQLGNKALVEDATGKGYVVQEGTYVGQNDGIVKKVFEDRIVVEEYRRDPIEDQLVANEVILKLKKVEAED